MVDSQDLDRSNSMGLFSNVFGIFGGVAKSLTKAFDFLEENKVIETLNKGLDLIQYALPVVKTVAALTPTSLDDMAIAVLEKYGLPAAKLFDESATGLDKLIQDSGKQKLAIEILRRQMVEAIESGGKVHLGDRVIGSVEEILGLSDNSLAVAVEQALALLKASKVVPASPAAPEPATEPQRTVTEIEARLARLRNELLAATDKEEIEKLNKKIVRQTAALAEAKKREGI